MSQSLRYFVEPESHNRIRPSAKRTPDRRLEHREERDLPDPDDLDAISLGFAGVAVSW
jgi:hypothetical protein